jgi:hypothetical protein
MLTYADIDDDGTASVYQLLKALKSQAEETVC